jgi:membrane-bound lytic murein transglycosylase D
MSVSDFNHYNPGFNNVLSRGANYKLQLPSDKMDEFKTKKFKILNESVEQLLQSVKTDAKAADKPKSK